MDKEVEDWQYTQDCAESLWVRRESELGLQAAKQTPKSLLLCKMWASTGELSLPRYLFTVTWQIWYVLYNGMDFSFALQWIFLT